MEDNISTIEELNATIASLREAKETICAVNQELLGENQKLQAQVKELETKASMMDAYVRWRQEDEAEIARLKDAILAISSVCKITV